MKKSELREIIREELLNEGKDGGIIQKADKKFLEKKTETNSERIFIKEISLNIQN